MTLLNDIPMVSQRVRIYRDEPSQKWITQYRFIATPHNSWSEAWKYFDFLNGRAKQLEAQAYQWARIV